MRRRGKINISVSSHVPKPHTPFQWEAMNPRDELLAKQSFVRSCNTSSYLKLKFHNVDESYLEAVFSRGDRRLAAALLKARERGIRMDAWSECFDRSRLAGGVRGSADRSRLLRAPRAPDRRDPSLGHDHGGHPHALSSERKGPGARRARLTAAKDRSSRKAYSMEAYEKLGAFYLGRVYDLAEERPSPRSPFCTIRGTFSPTRSAWG